MIGVKAARVPSKRLFYGWKMVITLGITELTSWGILYYAFAVIATPMQAEQGWSRVAVNGAFSLALLLSGLAALPVGRWIDRHGTRALMTVGSCAATLLVLAWSQVTRLPELYVIWAGIGVTLAAVLYEPAFAVVATWFRRERSRALTVLTFLGGLASLVFVPLTERLVRFWGWRSALVVLAIILAAVTILPHALVLRRYPADLGLLPDGDAAVDNETPAPSEHNVSLRDALRGATFWWIGVAFSLSLVATVAITVSLFPYLLAHGYSSSFAAVATGSLGGLSVGGRLIFTPLGDRMSRQTLTVLLFALQVIALVALLAVHSWVGVIMFVALFGASSGALTPARAGLIADYYGATAYGAINGVQALLLTLARALAPVGVALVYTIRDSYTPVFWLIAGICACAAGAAWQLRHNHFTTRIRSTMEHAE